MVQDITTPAGTEQIRLGDDRIRELKTDLMSGYYLPPGTIMMFGGSSPPPAWLMCDGSVVSQTTYAALFAVIGTTWNTGGEGAGNFRLPDLRGRTPIGAGTGSGLTARTLGQAAIGAETHALASGEVPATAITDPGHFHDMGNHTHSTPAHQHPLDSTSELGGTAATTDEISDTTGAAVANAKMVRWTTGGAVVITVFKGQTTSSGGGTSGAPSTNNTQTKTTGITAAASGSGGAHNNMQPSAVVNMMIKT